MIHEGSSSGIPSARTHSCVWGKKANSSSACFPGSSISFLFVYASSPSTAPTLSVHSDEPYYIRRCGNHTQLLLTSQIPLMPLHFHWDAAVYCWALQNSPQMSSHQWAHQLCIIQSEPEKTGCRLLTASWTHSWHRDLWGILKSCLRSYDSNMWITRLVFSLSPAPSRHTFPMSGKQQF